MRIHPVTGRVAHGIAGAGVYVDGVPVPGVPPVSGMPDWWGDRLLYVGADSTRLMTCAPDGSASDVVADGPVTFVRASRDWWAAFDPSRGVWTSTGLVLPEAVLLDMAPDGTLVVGDHYHEQEGSGLSLYQPGMSQPVHRVPDARPTVQIPYVQAAALDVSTVLWTEDGGRTLRTLTGRVSLPWVALHPTLAYVAGRLWVCYLRAADDAVIAHPWSDPTVGFCTIPGAAYGPAVALVGGWLVLRWSATAGETTHGLRAWSVDPATAGPIPPVVVAPPPLPPVFPPEPPPLPPLRIAIDHYTPGGPAPYRVTADYHVEGHSHSPVQVFLTLDGQRVAMETQPAGQLAVTVDEPAEYRLGAVVDCDGRRAQTGAIRIVRVTPAPPVPTPTPIQTGKAGYTQAAEEARHLLTCPTCGTASYQPNDQCPNHKENHG